MECNEDNCPIMLGMQNLFYEFMLGKPYKEREHNTELKPSECSENQTQASTNYKDIVLEGLEKGNLNDDLFWHLRVSLFKRSLLQKQEHLLPALTRLDMPEEFYVKVWNEWREALK